MKMNCDARDEGASMDISIVQVPEHHFLQIREYTRLINRGDVAQDNDGISTREMRHGDSGIAGNGPRMSKKHFAIN